MFRVCCLILFLVADTRQLSITKFSVPQSVEVGHNAELRCEYDLKPEELKKVIFVKWWWRPFGEDKQQIYQRTVGQPAKSTQHTIDMQIKENDTLVLLNIHPNASGIYECEVSNIEEVRKEQELIVYAKGTGPRLDITDVAVGPGEESVERSLLECAASHVAPLPDLKITINEKEINVTKNIKKSDDDGLYDIFANTTIEKNLVVGALLACQLSYTDLNITGDDFVDFILYDKTGELTSTEMPEDSTDLSASKPVSLQNASDDASQLCTSGIFLFCVLILSNLLSTK
ncbi:uncharacterized protein LOC101740585 isoform X1 [Bombyx mori]|uniref:Ig-like domain-containing protein n=1 Tax=Bombyx mori TaxID=7091 RepID=A0A8R1WGL3_BOMMO|nr:uncharacterized protein LOC101740585 isoform X2 [Bombyx mori]